MHRRLLAVTWPVPATDQEKLPGSPAALCNPDARLGRQNVVVLVLRSAFWALVAPGTVLVWGPLAILNATEARFHLGAGRWAGLALMAVGVAGLLWCIWDFARVGQGTLSPTDAPRFVVRGGLYRYVRNPMYLSVLTVLAGEVVLSGSLWLIAWAGAFAVWFVSMAVLFEEPRLKRQFGESYATYLSEVPRWLPGRRTRRPSGD